MKEEIRKKIASFKALQEMTIADLCATARFRENLAAYMTAQRTDREAIRDSYKAMKKLGGAKGYKLPAHPIDRVIDLSVEDFAVEYMSVINKTSTRPAAEREYIRQLGQQAYNLTVAQYVVDEYPELKKVLLPKSKAN